MQLFFSENLDTDIIALSPEESKHCVRVLRKTVGDKVFFTDGRGRLAEAVLISDNKEECVAQISKITENYGERTVKFHLAVAPTKNHDRMEWLVEKAVEIGAEKISFIICDHSERKKVDAARLMRIAVSALKQSNTAYLPVIEQIFLKDFFRKYDKGRKLIASCESDTSLQLAELSFQKDEEVIVLIGPEGDFSSEELRLASECGYAEVKLGSRRLRTETAALFACCCIAVKQC